MQYFFCLKLNKNDVYVIILPRVQGGVQPVRQGGGGRHRLQGAGHRHEGAGPQPVHGGTRRSPDGARS